MLEAWDGTGTVSEATMRLWCGDETKVANDHADAGRRTCLGNLAEST